MPTDQVTADPRVTHDVAKNESLWFKLENAKPIYPALAQHQLSEDRWELRELLAFLQHWSGIFITEFHLNICRIHARQDATTGSGSSTYDIPSSADT